jgi:uncharacterized membrane protein YkvA (DUF1232 family)
MKWVDSTRAWARRIRLDAMTLWFARAHPATPWYAKAIGIFVLAYALSPIDLIPDFIPVLGYLDDIVLLPVLIWLTLRMLPPEVLAASRLHAQQWLAQSRSRPRSLAGAVAIVLIWTAAAAGVALWLAPGLQRG